jgi:UDP-glucose 4-epimerase
MQTILVTGGAGFIGSHTVVELVAAGYRPVIIDNFVNSEPFIVKNLEKLVGKKLVCYQEDYRDSARLEQIIKDEHVSGVIHFAAYKAVGESVSNPLKYYENNVAGLITLLEACEAAGIHSVVFSSSCVVYGEPELSPVTEDSPLKPAVSPYGATKQMGETILCDATVISRSFNAIALRYFNPIGAHPSGLIGELPRGVPTNLVPLLTQTSAGKRPSLTVHGTDYPTADGSCIRDYIHVVDLARAHVRALSWLESQPKASHEVLNIGSGMGSSVLEVIRTFEDVTRQKVAYNIGPRRPGDVVSTFADVTKAGQLLGWHTENDLATALADAWRWQQTL